MKKNILNFAKKYRFAIVQAILMVVGIVLTTIWDSFGVLAFSIIYGLVMNLIPDEK